MSIGVLIVDDSRFVRRRLAAQLEAAGGIRVVGQAGDPYEARQVLIDVRPDCMILDINMPKMDGLTFLELVMAHHPLPVIVLSAAVAKEPQLAREARRLGAAAVIAKPSSDDIDRYHDELLTSIRRISGRGQPAGRRESPPRPSGLRPSVEPATGSPSATLLTIGASTGGTEAIRTVVSALPASVPGTVIVQHMPPTFTASFADRLDQSSALRVVEARGGETLMQGHAYVAPGGHHLVVRRSGATFRLELDEGPRVHYQKPALDVTFNSIATAAGARAVGVILTGMGRDGADGLLAMRRAGAPTIGQDEATSVVYGMPRMAQECGAVEIQCPLDTIAQQIGKALKRLPGA